eukprot:COSAG01_NODE_2459_length_7655_cov_138.985442_2_plen_30_part_00
MIHDRCMLPFTVTVSPFPFLFWRALIEAL